MSTPRMFRKKPVTIEAMQWDGTAEGAGPILNWIHENGGSCDYRCDPDKHGRCPEREEAHWISIRTLEGEMSARRGDWIIRGVAGEFYPCKTAEFAATYEEVQP